ncbi:DUF3139 domain-containing protein [Metasolibacillus sp.]|uniref:DUF3139 domain-containing protein n=1 Tax=Metasolibacillus sp. TaxID=2703680 RepID=UPI0025EAC0CF|nr:DUF3139 domain-containing protein [Metasolibacillus sp.]MCT6923755.1 DUF3139 domain-containing protein [Metasolibacillus sp.]MCT6940012.1 DUF3139 domain-containing protein [Metasolibacillus sp.]
MRKIWFFSILSLTIAVIIVCIYIYNIPGSMEEAEKAFDEYLNVQGVNKENIATKEIKKDYKIGGYYFDVTYKDEPPNYRYNYFYQTSSKRIVLLVFDGNRGIDEGMKYPPIK